MSLSVSTEFLFRLSGNLFPIFGITIIRYASGGNPQPKNGKVIGHIVEGVYVPLGEPSAKAEPDMLSYGASAFCQICFNLKSEL